MSSMAQMKELYRCIVADNFSLIYFFNDFTRLGFSSLLSSSGVFGFLSMVLGWWCGWNRGEERVNGSGGGRSGVQR